MVKYQDIVSGEESLSLIGLGYVGLPIAIAFAHRVKVIGFDLNEKKISLYKKGIDPTNEVGNESVAKTSVQFTSDPLNLRRARFHIVAVPTPVREDNRPDLTPVKSASTILGKQLQPGSVVVFESTVYPGVTEEICVPILEQESGMICGKDFFVGYSPERINPGDNIHRLQSIIKVVSGIDEATLDLVARVYEMVVEVGVYRANSIKVAEAAKVIENSQRDINIAFMNELSRIFHLMGIDTLEVLEAAGTKWNFLDFRPGLVGGHCIGVDPYYLTYKAEQLGYHSQIILSGRRINDDMGRYVAECVIKTLIRSGEVIQGCKIGLLGFTFKENCPDTRNTRVIDIVHELGDYGIIPIISDPIADRQEAMEHYSIEIESLEAIMDMDCLIVAVGHDAFRDLKLDRMLRLGGLLVDIKGIYQPKEIVDLGYKYWRL